MIFLIMAMAKTNNVGNVIPSLCWLYCPNYVSKGTTNLGPTVQGVKVGTLGRQNERNACAFFVSGGKINTLKTLLFND